MTAILLLVICMLASAIGAIVGAGGGVIIKPVLDMFDILPVSTVSFCSGCTVLGMSVCSLIRNRNDGVKLQLRTSTALAVGAVAGGLVGKWMFELVRNAFSDERVLGAIQAIFLTLITVGVFIYVCNKDKLPSKNIKNLFVTIVIGLFLGVISSFLGIGGGTSNVAVLFFFFSMAAKEAAKNSLYIIIFSQISSIVSAAVTNSIPQFEWEHLICMIAGGIAGALIGAAVSKRIDNKGVEKVLKALLIIIILIDFYNVIKYTIL
ncbi:MAG: sulfite exporter TauE/SafE family protein [Lachnospiraceae bacterium]|nr:sulfite exporter TauE/SafE family protein [Lachnospiraceae bacterium]